MRPHHPPSKKTSKKKQSKRCFSVATLFKFSFSLLLIWSLIASFYYLWALTYDLSKIGQMSQRSLIYDRYGKVYSLAGGENRQIVPFEKVSNYFVNALISREDARFYEHHGVDPIGIARAAARNLFLGGIRQGGSTITQQLARNSFPLGGHNLNRKLLEAAMAFRIETELSKEKILELYMNRIYFGPGLYGVESASQAYFNRPASQMTLAQGALLAGLIRSPNHLSPYNNLPGALQQQALVLRRMEELNLITQEEHSKALNEKIEPPSNRLLHFQNSWAVDAILHELNQVLPPEKMEAGPLHIMTTIDPGLQHTAEKSLAWNLAEIEKRSDFQDQHSPPKNKMSSSSKKKDPVQREEKTAPLQGALLAIDNSSGGIVAIVGGRDYKTSKYNRATTALRQVGSAAKPFVYEEAFRQGMTPESLVNDAPLTSSELPEGFKNYHPQNSDGTFHEWLPASQGLIHSRNTMSVRVGIGAGLKNVATTLEHLGLAEKIPPYPSICLGSFESTLRNITAAYTALATGGGRLQPHFIEQVTDADGKILFLATRGRLPILDPAATRITTSILEKVLTEGTASRASSLGLKKLAAGKTGTTDHFFDAWFLGFTQGLTCGVWVGFDQPKTIMRGGYGAELALPIWVDFMESPAADRYPAGEF
ncbi:MAG: PBP1A family penicillin-binding protein [Verrucomicrobia bacterium]|nr:MAG: PBP1A family penicillin-binding protein [Verrucomicrobiota bacterium]